MENCNQPLKERRKQFKDGAKREQNVVTNQPDAVKLLMQLTIRRKKNNYQMKKLKEQLQRKQLQEIGVIIIIIIGIIETLIKFKLKKILVL